ncbi:hypothetical protein LJR219_005184 [Phenylobacterium sp. LjRoot219]|uniref:TolB family protein n=1 Tax=Phenylobacterium sp. LjRoot219 TaxID=3342283 RepID=UPI003ED092DC
MKRITSILLAAAGLSVALGGGAASAPPVAKSGSPEDKPPPNVEQLTYFGERASWSPDGRKIAFMSKSFGDAFVVDVRTKQIRLLTHYPSPGYLRVQYLPNGDFLLVGARKFDDVRKTRFTDQELWYLKADGGAPIALDQKLTEGIAISRSRMKVAWAVDPRTHPGEVTDVVIYTADIALENGEPKLVNKREAVRLKRPDCVGGEPQDFRNDDRELIYVCYRFNKVLLADVMGVDLTTGQTTAYRKLPDEYNEVEGVFPDGQHALVESSRDQATNTSKTIDIWKLRLAPSSPEMVRMTRWGDYPGYKASNPVVSPDGRTIAFQSGRSGDEAGVGYGIFLLKQK